MSAYDDIRKERDYQKSLGWKDENNNSFTFVAYIVNYASRFALPNSFDMARYSFRQCMVKCAAICVAAIEWFDEKHPTDCVDIPKSVLP